MKHFTVIACSEKLVTIHNIAVHIREDLGPSLLHASPTELPMLNTRERRTTRVKTLKLERSIDYHQLSGKVGEFENSWVENQNSAVNYSLKQEKSNRNNDHRVIIKEH